MKDASDPTSAGWTVRRAQLVDVPVVARLVDASMTTESPHAPGIDVISATRLVLTHVGLEYGKFWVAVNLAGEVRAATVLLPPRWTATGDSTGPELRVRAALRLQFGRAAAALPEPSRVASLSSLTSTAAGSSILLAVAVPGVEWVLDQLLAVALAAVPADALPVMTVLPGRAQPALLRAGFEPSGSDPTLPMLLRH